MDAARDLPKVSHLGNASRTPPSTGITAPVVKDPDLEQISAGTKVLELLYRHAVHLRPGLPDFLRPETGAVKDGVGIDHVDPDPELPSPCLAS